MKREIKNDENPQPAYHAGLSRRSLAKAEARRTRAFSLVEVMIAIAVFCMAMFVILALVSSALANARRLQRPMVDAAMIASELSLTNQLVEDRQSGDFGKAYPDYSWTANVTEVQTNKLFRVDYVVQRDASHEVMQKMSVLFYRPQSKAGSLDGATVGQ
jgi:prepilin-type N-terminal cleavage/methylation domain-containing protein